MHRGSISEKKTIHTSRTLMFSELAKVMDHALQDDRYLESIQENVINKRTKSNQEKTFRYLTQLYGFDTEAPAFKCFKYFWQQVENQDKPLLAVLYAINRDYLLTESIPLIISTPIGEKVSIEKLIESLDHQHPNRFSVNTSRSIAQNIASSWKQAGYITGKVKNIRTQVLPSYQIIAFALVLAYLNGERGEYLMKSKWVSALGINETLIRDLAYEAAKRDLLHYQFAGAVTTVSFQNLFNKIGIHGF